MHIGKQKILKSQCGFTIIEVMIVLAIAALIILIVFLAIPALERNSRNYDRKNYSTLIYAALNDFYSTNGHMPGAMGNPTSPSNQAEICNFLQSLPRATPGTPCISSTASYTSVNGSVSEDCLSIKAEVYTICYQNWQTVSHGYIGPSDEISIMLAHWCNSGSGTVASEPSTYPVAGNDINTIRYAIWTPLENNSTPFCLDNFPSN